MSLVGLIMPTFATGLKVVVLLVLAVRERLLWIGFEIIGLPILLFGVCLFVKISDSFIVFGDRLSWRLVKLEFSWMDGEVWCLKLPTLKFLKRDLNAGDELPGCTPADDAWLAVWLFDGKGILTGGVVVVVVNDDDAAMIECEEKEFVIWFELLDCCCKFSNCCWIWTFVGKFELILVKLTWLLILLLFVPLVILLLVLADFLSLSLSLPFFFFNL